MAIPNHSPNHGPNPWWFGQLPVKLVRRDQVIPGVWIVYSYCTYRVNVAKPIVNLRFRGGLYNPCMVIYDDLIQNGNGMF